MMKRITTIMLILCAIFAFSLAVSAEITADEISELFYLDSDDELLKLYVDGLPEDVQSELDTTRAHLGYSMILKPQLYEKYYEEGDFIGLLDVARDHGKLHNYPYIYIPFAPDGEVTEEYVDLYDKKTLESGYVNDNDYRIYSTHISYYPEKIADAINEYGDIGEIEYITQIDMTGFSMESIYIRTDKGEFIIPMNSKLIGGRDAFWKVMNKGELYDMEFFMDKLITVYVSALNEEMAKQREYSSGQIDLMLNDDGEWIKVMTTYEQDEDGVWRQVLVEVEDEENTNSSDTDEKSESEDKTEEKEEITDSDIEDEADEKKDEKEKDKKDELPEEDPIATAESSADKGNVELEMSILSEDEAELVVLIDDYKIREIDVNIFANDGVKTNVIVKYKHVVTDTTMVIKTLYVYDENGREIEGITYQKNGWDYNFTVENSVAIKLSVVPVGALPLEDRAKNAEILVNVNGRVLDFDVKPILENDRTLVPLRGIFEALGAEVSWDDETWTVTAARGDVTVRLTIGEKVLYRNGKAIEIDVPARLEGWRTLVPLRAVSEAFGSYVEWHDNARTVMIAD